MPATAKDPAKHTKPGSKVQKSLAVTPRRNAEERRASNASSSASVQSTAEPAKQISSSSNSSRSQTAKQASASKDDAPVKEDQQAQTRPNASSSKPMTPEAPTPAQPPSQAPKLPPPPTMPPLLPETAEAAAAHPKPPGFPPAPNFLPPSPFVQAGLGQALQAQAHRDIAVARAPTELPADLREELKERHRLLECSQQHGIRNEDDRPSREYRPRNPYVHRDAAGQEVYLREALESVEDRNRNLFARFETKTLLAVFYHQPNTVRQYLAANELKTAGWRFHTKYQTWMMRAEEPRIQTSEFERGLYFCFDFENKWDFDQREFTIDYAWIEHV